MPSEAPEMAVKCNMHIYVRLIEVADLILKVKFYNIRVYWGHLEINRPARPLRPITPLVGRNPVRRGMIMQIGAAPTTHRPAKPAVRADLSLSSRSHIVPL